MSAGAGQGGPEGARPQREASAAGRPEARAEPAVGGGSGGARPFFVDRRRAQLKATKRWRFSAVSHCIGPEGGRRWAVGGRQGAGRWLEVWQTVVEMVALESWRGW